MIKKLFLLIFILAVFSFPQDKQNPNVELPDFVITGRDIISIQNAKKLSPDLVSTVSKDFLQPVYSPEELGLQDISNPISQKLNLLDTLNNYNGYIDLGVGFYSLPKADAVYSIPFTNGIFNSYFNGSNTLNYLDTSNSSRSEWNGGINFSYFVDNEAPFFGGTKIKLHGNYGVSAYKLYASNTPKFVRNLNKGDFSFDINNLLNRNFIFDAKISSRYTYLPDENFSENLLNVTAYSEAEFSAFSLSADLNFKNQFLTLNRDQEASRLNNNMDRFFNIIPLAGLNISSLIKVKFGFNYAKTNNDNFFAPYGSLGMRFNKNLSLFGEINPHAEFVSNGDFLRENQYNSPSGTPNVFLKKTFALNAILKYEYDKYFEIDGGVDYYSAKDLPYYTDKNNAGKFDVALTKATSYSAFINLLFHAGPYGIFYSNAELNSTENNNGKIIPYYPQAKASLVYGYNFFNNDLNTEASINFYSKQFADLENIKKIDPYIDMGLKFKYLIFPNFRLTLELLNLFDYNNYLWNNYKEPPLNILGGFSYQW